jgi:hypothetical protein
MFTEQMVITAARERVGSKTDISVSEQYVPTQAIHAEMIEDVMECCRLFGTATSRKEVYFVTAVAPLLQTPSAPTLTASNTGGQLVTGSYQYRVSATVGVGETQASAQALVAATIAGTAGSVTITWPPVAGATGYIVYGRTSGDPNNPPQKLKMVTGSTSWLDTGIAAVSGGLPMTNTTGGNSGQMQDYQVDTYVGTDVLEILEVVRSGAYQSDSFLEPAQVDPRTGVPMQKSAFIDQGFQQSALEVIQAQEQFRNQDKFDWTVVPYNNTMYLRLMPPPEMPEQIVVVYSCTGESVESLPDEARPAIEHAATAAIMNLSLNRVNSGPPAAGESSRDRRYWIEMMERQRDYYRGRYRAALARRNRQ